MSFFLGCGSRSTWGAKRSHARPQGLRSKNKFRARMRRRFDHRRIGKFGNVSVSHTSPTSAPDTPPYDTFERARLTRCDARRRRCPPPASTDFSHVEPVLPHLLVEGGAVDVELGGGCLAVPVVALEGLLDDPPLGAFQRDVQGQRLFEQHV